MYTCKTVTAFEADDGSIFKTLRDASNHNVHLAKIKKRNSLSVLFDPYIRAAGRDDYGSRWSIRDFVIAIVNDYDHFVAAVKALP